MDARRGEGGCDFSAGERVICVDAGPLRTEDASEHACNPGLILGVVYTVAGVVPPEEPPEYEEGGWGVLLAEVEHPIDRRVGFGPWRFRRLERPSDAFLTSCLKAAHEPLFTRIPVKAPAHSDTGVG
jgi:hypothetical protein